MSDYYHDLGVFLRFKDNPILRNTVFLETKWATNAVYKVTDNPTVRDSFGKFSFDQLRGIWRDPQEFPEDKFVELVELMKSFELCFELPQGRIYIIPELLRANQPELNWNYRDNLRFKFEYDFMPAGVMTRFIVITHDLIQENQYWKDGMVLSWENTQALVIKTHPRRIEVWITGPERKMLLGTIRRHFEYINKPFHNLEVRELLPCVCRECAAKEEGHFFTYDEISRAREKGKSRIECKRSFEDVPIETLLGEIGHREYQTAPARLQTLKIFLASPGDLEAERREIELLVRKENERLFDQGLFLRLVIWEDLLHSFQGERVQDYFNAQMLQCEVVITMFFKKVGKFTKEEFEVAYESFKKDGNPKFLYVYFKDAAVKMSEIDKQVLQIRELKEQIVEAEQIYQSFESVAELQLKLKRQIDLIVAKRVSSHQFSLDSIR